MDVLLLSLRRDTVTSVLTWASLLRNSGALHTSRRSQRVLSLSGCAALQWLTSVDSKRRQPVGEAQQHSSTETASWEAEAREESEPRTPTQREPLTIFLLLIECVCGYVCVYACTLMGHGTYVEVRRTCKSQLSSFTRWIWRLNLGYQAWQQAPVPTGPFGWPRDPSLSKKSQRHYKFQIRHLHSWGSLVCPGSTAPSGVKLIRSSKNVFNL